MFGKASALKSLSLFLIVNTSTVAFGFALAYRWSRQSAASSQRNSSITLLSSDREQDGLVGPVHQLRTETAKLINRAGKLVEGPRQLMELTTYDAGGAKVESAYYLVQGSSLAGREEYEYDDKGNIKGMTVRAADNSTLSKESYKYEFDEVGNWTKMTASTLVFDAGKVTTKSTEVTYRSITYYFDKSIANIVEQNPASNDSRTSVETPDDEAQGSGGESRETFIALRRALEDWIASNNARDIEKQISFYGPKLYFYYRARNVSRESVREDKARMYERAEFIDVRSDAPEITLERDGRAAIMRFRKQYVVKSGGSERYGEVLQELRWQRTDEGWRIVGERDVRVMR
ncbi:MAG TPA: hypothetical protein VF658_21455 [Pyrinomonadaceae bacterium]|jgi:hypothetical protein